MIDIKLVAAKFDDMIELEDSLATAKNQFTAVKENVTKSLKQTKKDILADLKNDDNESYTMEDIDFAYSYYKLASQAEDPEAVYDDRFMLVASLGQYLAKDAKKE